MKKFFSFFFTIVVISSSLNGLALTPVFADPPIPENSPVTTSLGPIGSLQLLAGAALTLGASVIGSEPLDNGVSPTAVAALAQKISAVREEAAQRIQMPSAEIGGLTFGPGLHATPDGAPMTLTSDMTLNGRGTYVFYTPGAFNTTAGINVFLQRGALANDIFWVAEGAVTVGANGTLAGTFMSSAAITIGASTILTGNLYATAATTIGASTTVQPLPPLFTLSSASETASIKTLSRGLLVASTGGRIASFNISPPAPSGMTFDIGTGSLSGTPTNTQPITLYTITGTNVSGHYSQPFSLTVLDCETGGVCYKGDKGPGGGTVFYVSTTGFNCGVSNSSTGSPTGGACHYLEAAPTTGTNAWTDMMYAWSGNTTNSLRTSSSTAIGAGYANTIAMNVLSSTASMAGTISQSYRGPHSLADWYLGSSSEMTQLYSSRLIVAGFAIANPALYWTSSECLVGSCSSDVTPRELAQNFTVGNQGGNLRRVTNYVRPIRAF
jgi:hypothetical protein